MIAAIYTILEVVGSNYWSVSSKFLSLHFDLDISATLRC